MQIYLRENLGTDVTRKESLTFDYHTEVQRGVIQTTCSSSTSFHRKSSQNPFHNYRVGDFSSVTVFLNVLVYPFFCVLLRKKSLREWNNALGAMCCKDIYACCLVSGCWELHTPVNGRNKALQSGHFMQKQIIGNP